MKFVVVRHSSRILVISGVQVFVDQVNSDVVAVTRHCPGKRESYILVARTSFRPPDQCSESIRIQNLNIPGTALV